MSNEEFERRMAFIVEQEAQFASDIQQLRESQTQTDQVVAQTGEIVARLANVKLEGFKDVNAKINAFVDSQIRTDESLRNLIAVVDRSFSEGRNVGKIWLKGNTVEFMNIAPHSEPFRLGDPLNAPAFS